MILYDLHCSNGHVFESWFRDSNAFSKQSKDGQIPCPLCGDLKVERAPMAPRISSGKSQRKANKEYTERALTVLTNAQEFLDKHCDDVGGRFAEEARKIHYGDTKKRNIWGEATLEEAEELKEEGIEFGEIPFPLGRKDG